MTGKNTAIQAVGYIRVSTEGQAMDGVSLDVQREKIQAYCSLHGLTLIETMADEGISGKRADNRPGLQRALTEACRRKAVLVVYSMSRLCRSTRDAIAIADRIEKCGADLASISEKIDTTSSMGRFFFRLMASLGELERDLISERTTGAMQHLKRQGRRIAPRLPYGRRLAEDGKHLEPEPSELEIVAQMQAQRDGGRSYHAIAAWLNEQGIKSKQGGKWFASAVRSVLLYHEQPAAVPA